MNAELLDLHRRRKELSGPNTKSSLHNSWRARVYNKKGKEAGFPDSWRTFEGFKNDIPDGFIEGLILTRIDVKQPFSKENSKWIEKSQQQIGKLITLTYNGETKTLLEWSAQFNLNYTGLRQRYFKGKAYTVEQILFGKQIKPKNSPTDILELETQKQKDKISKMLSAYRNKDKKRNFEFNLDTEFLTKLVSQSCTYCGDTKLIGADRIDNSKGHTKDNVLPCCYSCNTVRSNMFSVEEMKILGQTIKLIKENRK